MSVDEAKSAVKDQAKQMLDNLKQAGKDIGKSYVDHYKELIKKATDDIAKLTALGDVDFEDAFSDSENLMDGLSDAMDVATSVCGALGDNPLLDSALKRLSDQYGFDFTSPLELAKSLMSGKGNDLMKVVGAMLQFPLKKEEYLAQANLTITAAEKLVSELNAHGIDLSKAQSLIDAQQIPDEIVQRMITARRELTKSMTGDFLEDEYQKGINNLKQALTDMGNINVWADSLGAASLTEGVRLIFNQIAFLIKGYIYMERQIHRELVDLINVIRTTPVMLGSTTKAYGKSKAAIHDLNVLIAEINKVNENEIAYVPQYMVALGTIITVLKMAKPYTNTTAPTALGNTSIPFDEGKLSALYLATGRIYTFTKNPGKAALLESHVLDSRTKYDEAKQELDNFNAQINILWTHLPGIKDFLNEVKTLLAGAGLDKAADAIASGDVTGLMSMDDKTATKVGAVLVSLETVNEVLKAYGINASEEIEKYIKKTYNKYISKKVSNDSKKKDKINKLKKTLTEAADALNDISKMVEEVTGTVVAVEAIIANYT